jgi:adenosylhomocysteine nucleosidase
MRVNHPAFSPHNRQDDAAPMSPRVLFVFATEAEAAPLLDSLGFTAREEDPSRLRALDGIAHLLVTGMGPDAAARSLDAVLRSHTPDLVVNAGIAGALRPGFGVGEMIDVMGAAHAPEDIRAPLDFHTASSRRPEWWPQRLRRGLLLTRRTPLFDPAEANRLATKAHLVDMEGAAVLQVCADRDVPCVLLKSVSDFADERATLLANLARASAALAGVLRAAFQPVSSSGVMP